ncbi:hypothetical protein DQ04_23371010 [Trypanosoma grayi]|uniref:hypothetical protein n=1 Tax=Trypanosoma grayi TaxID=71804 RepID=UPI0004F44FFF|nr:hypothetical protein DQ04_23371010 [Trypanosoma grayi]KEG05336.1 hypothetical protein DQ04_23371010 [Trypanosoma grayi]
MYALSGSLQDFQPLVRRVPGHEGAGAKNSPSELNAIDWAKFVAFERDVARDLRRAKETAARARRLTLAPQRLLALLNAY